MPAPAAAAGRLAAVALAVVLATPAAAQDPNPPPAPVAPPSPRPAPRRAPEYDVYVSEDEEVVERIAPRRVIDQDRIRERSARTLDEVLELEPGVYVRNGNEGVPRVDMRGLRSRHVLLLLDGIPFSSTEDGQFDPTLIPTESMERVKLAFGNASVLYGDGPMAGVVQVETKRPEAGVHGVLGSDFRSGWQKLGRFALTARQGAFDGLVAGSAYDGDGFPLSDGFDPSGSENGGHRDNAHRDRLNLLLRGGWTPRESARIGALVVLVDGAYGLPPIAIDDPSDPFASRARYERVEDQDGISGQLSTQWDPDGPLEVRGWAYVNDLEEDRRRYDDDAYDSMDDPRVSGTFRADNESLVAGQALHASWSFGRYGKLEGVFQSRREQFESDGKIRDVRLGGGRFGVRRFDESWRQMVYNGGLEYAVEPFRDVGIVVGYGHSFLDKDGGGSENGSLLLTGATWTLRPGTRIRGSVSRKLRFPSLRQLYDQGSGNPELESEHSWDFEIGLSQALPGGTLVDVTGFSLEVHDYIETDEATGFYANQDRYRFRGVELTVASQPLEALDVFASYTFMESDNRSSHGEQDHLQNRPQHRVALETRYRLPWGFALRSALYYVADQFVYSRQAPLDRRSTGNYFLADLRLAKTLLEERVWLYFGVDNVGDENYQESYGVPGPGRVFYGGLEGRF